MSPPGDWTVHGLGNRPVAHRPTLMASLDHARRECSAAPATIELFLDGLYAVVQQEEGWPRPLVPLEPTVVNGPAGWAGHLVRSWVRLWRDRRAARKDTSLYKTRALESLQEDAASVPRS
jgi:hypothetical protein